jgi:hypothetical protein
MDATKTLDSSLYFKAQIPYTGENTVEISCHGSHLTFSNKSAWGTLRGCEWLIQTNYAARFLKQWNLIYLKRRL